MIARLSRLDGVNRILRGSREHPVSSLTDDAVNDTEIAQSTLDEANRQVQAPGLHCNTYVEDFKPNADGEIVLPDNTLHATTWEGSSCIDVCLTVEDERVKLYQTRNNMGTDFSNVTCLRVRWVELLPFQDLPVPTQFFVADMAAQEYQMAVHGSGDMDRVLTARLNRSRAWARAYDARSRKGHSIFNSKRTVDPFRAAKAVSRPDTPRSY